MRSSSEEDEIDSMFPSATDPPTPQNDPNLSHFSISELSPPTSQDPQGEDGRALQDDFMDLTQAQDPMNSSSAREPMITSSRSSRTLVEAEEEPGYAWNNKKAREEYQRAEELLVDKNFSLRANPCIFWEPGHLSANAYGTGEFGDLFDESSQKDVKASK